MSKAPAQIGRRTTDIVLLAATLPIIIVLLLLHLQMALQGGSTIPTMRVDFGPMPIVLDTNRDITENIQPGDKLLKIGDVDVRNVSPATFKLTIAHQLSNESSVFVELRRDSQMQTGYLLRRIEPFVWSIFPVTAFLIVGVLVLWQAPNSPRARTFYIGFATLSVFQSGFEFGSETQIAVGMVVFLLFGSISLVCILLWVIGFPRDLSSQDRGARLPNWTAYVVALLWMSPRLNFYLSGPLPADSYDAQTYGLNVFLFLFIIATLSWNYRCVDAANQRRTRWVLLGVYVALVPNILLRTVGLMLNETTFEVMYNVSRLFYLAVPISIWIAVAHFHLYDVDRVFGGAITYTILVVLLAVGAEAVLEPVAGLIAESAGFNADIGQMIFVAAIAALAVPMRTMIKPIVDRFVLSKQKPFTEAMTELMTTLSNQESLHLPEIATAAAAKTAATLGVRTCVLALNTDQTWRIWYSQGVQTEINNEVIAGLGSTLSNQYTPIHPPDVSDWNRIIQANIVFPLHHNNETIGFLSFSRKTSGDIFTGPEQSMLVAMTALLSIRAAH